MNIPGHLVWFSDYLSVSRSPGEICCREVENYELIDQRPECRKNGLARSIVEKPVCVSGCSLITLYP